MAIFIGPSACIAALLVLLLVCSICHDIIVVAVVQSPYAASVVWLFLLPGELTSNLTAKVGSLILSSAG